MHYFPTAPFYTVSAVVTKLQRLDVTAQHRRLLIAHHVDPTSSDPRPRIMTLETRTGGNQVDVPLGPWPPGLVRSPLVRPDVVRLEEPELPS